MRKNPIEEATQGIVVPRRALALGLAALALPAKALAQAQAPSSPASAAAAGSSAVSPASLLLRNLMEIFNEPDEAKRRLAFAEIWAPDGVFYEPRAIHHGFEAINRAIIGMQKLSPPGNRFQLTSKPQSSYDAARLEWIFESADGTGDIYTGSNFGLVRDGKITFLVVFMDRPFTPPSPAAR